jgi:hypothetical protein
LVAGAGSARETTRIRFAFDFLLFGTRIVTRYTAGRMADSKSVGLTKNERLTLIIAVLALILSGLSLWDSHENSKREQVKSAPHVWIRSARLTRSLQLNNPLFLVLILQLENTGEIGVTVNHMQAHTNVLALPSETSLQACNSDLRTTVFKDDMGGTKLGRYEKEGTTGRNTAIASMALPLPASCTGTGWTLTGSVDFQGIDDAKSSYDSRDTSDVATFNVTIPTS